MFKGAGILYWKKENEKILISLGKRTVNPHKGYWSVPGGKKEVYDRDFYECGKREAKEEYFYNMESEFSKTVDLSFSKECPIFIPFLFEYHTFWVDVTGKDLNFSPNWEFEKIEWFETEHLPEKTHIGVYYALFFYGLL